MDRLDEALTICHAMFTEERPSFSGRYYRIDGALNVPRPIQPGGPPILVGGGGEQRTLQDRREARRHDPLVPARTGELKHKNEVLARHCEAIGRDPATIERTMAAPVLLAATESEAAVLLRANTA